MKAIKLILCIGIILGLGFAWANRSNSKNAPLTLIHEGKQYQLETQSDLHRVRVTSEADGSQPPPAGLVLIVRQKNRLTRRIRLTLTETTRDAVVYTGLIPSNILISGGVRFEIGTQGR